MRIFLKTLFGEFKYRKIKFIKKIGKLKKMKGEKI